MTAQLEIIRSRQERGNLCPKAVNSFGLVSVTSEPRRVSTAKGASQNGAAQPIRCGSLRAGSSRVQYTRIAAHLVGTSSAICRRHAHQLGRRPRTVESVVATPGRASDLPEDVSAIRKLLVQNEAFGTSPEILARMVAGIRAADAVIAGPLSPDDENTPGLLPHLADLASRAYRALRPPRSVITHPGFGQVARRFHYIQMSHQQARNLGAGASDIGILAHRLRQLQGEAGEFAITSFAGRGLLWAEGAWFEIEPIGDGHLDESVAEAAFSTAWVFARCLKGATAAQALARARAAAGKAARPEPVCVSGF
jgi:hypothetical protein